MNKKKITLIIMSTLVILGVGFYIGARIGKKSTNPVVKETVSSSTKNQESASKDVATSSDMKTSDSTTSKEERDLPNELLLYSDEEIEYARVWLTVMGEDYLDKIGLNDFNLNVTFIPKGTLVSEYGNYNKTSWPTDVIRLSGDVSAQGQVIYSSNFDGTVTTYPNAPSHWHYSEEQFKDEELYEPSLFRCNQ
ncbi:hypothetical protein [Vagococcus fluvialis]|uniref:hypothetical protein n=1 Tax=Vagococcus fluvialis TaxID=2738 RepID=UPI003D0CAA81